MLGNTGIYANKKRKKPVLKQKKISDGNEVVKSNPSKRHRDRLNGELDRLMDLLPFTEDVRSRLDKLSVLRLSVGYLRVKSYFKATIKNNHSSPGFSGVNGNNGNNGNNVNNVNNVDNVAFSEGDLLLQALNGFVIVVTAEGLVFYSSPTIKDYLGFHQSDVVHQSVFELIHTDDRSMFREQLHFALNPPPTPVDGDSLQIHANPISYSPEHLPPENSSFLERSFVCRFRCLLDNSSGFLALKFQGRLKYLYGQSLLRDNGARGRPQLALFAIAVPVQPPSIVEIRTKMLLFQTKHKMDFTPIGLDSRAKIILGYSETELCSRGSGYQFIHAADMMYCADNHIRMMKTGESGLTVFRLLSKSGGWIWVKSNAKLIFKAGRPEFIIAYQQAVANTEGEEYLQQRRLQLPFSFTTGEAILYDTGPTMDLNQFQLNKKFSTNDVKKDGHPESLLDCFLSQDEAIYTQTVEAPLPVDQMFTDSRALLKVTNEANTGESTVVKEEAKQSVMAVINSLEEMAQCGDFGAALQNLDLGDAELMEWENTLKRLGQDQEQQNNVRSDLDNVLMDDIFDYVDSVLFKEKGEDLMNPPSCLTGLNQQQDPFTHFSAGELSEPPLFPTPSPDRTFSPMNGLYAQQQAAIGGGGLSGPSVQSAQVFGSTHKLAHHGPQTPQTPQIPQIPQILPTNSSLPPLQQLQLQDIFCPSIELPTLTVPNISADDALATFQSCGQESIRHMGSQQRINGAVQQAEQVLLRQNHPAATLQSSVQRPNSVAPAPMDTLPPLIPCSDFSSSNTSNIPVGFSSPCRQGNPQLDSPSRPLQQWNQNQNQKLPHAGIVQNSHEAMPAFQSQNPQSQTFPCAGFWPRGINGLNQQGALPGGQAANHSSCMFNQHFSSSPPGGNVPPSSGALGLRVSDPTLDQSPVQASCYYQWNHSEPVVGTSAISQENANISPLATPPNMSAADYARSIQHYLQHNGQTQQTNGSGGGMFVAPPHNVPAYLME